MEFGRLPLFTANVCSKHKLHCFLLCWPPRCHSIPHPCLQKARGPAQYAYDQAIGLKNAAGQSWDDAMQAAYAHWERTKGTTQATWDDAKRAAWDQWAATVSWPGRTAQAAKVGAPVRGRAGQAVPSRLESSEAQFSQRRVPLLPLCRKRWALPRAPPAKPPPAPRSMSATPPAGPVSTRGTAGTERCLLSTGTGTRQRTRRSRPGMTQSTRPGKHGRCALPPPAASATSTAVS